MNGLRGRFPPALVPDYIAGPKKDSPAVVVAERVRWLVRLGLGCAGVTRTFPLTGREIAIRAVLFS